MRNDGDIWDEIVANFCEKYPPGARRTKETIQKKWSGRASSLLEPFKTEYDRRRRETGTGVSDASCFPYYDEMYDILKDDPTVYPEQTIDSTGVERRRPRDDEDEGRRTRRRVRADRLQEMVDQMKQGVNERQNRFLEALQEDRKETNQRIDPVLDIMEGILEELRRHE